MTNKTYKLSYFKSCKNKKQLNMSVVYLIQNTSNEKIYIGSAVKFSERIYRHLQDLLKNKHKNKLLQNSFNKDGIDCFCVKIIENINNINCLLEMEQKWLNVYFDNQKKCFNICKKAGNWKGNKHTIKTKKKISANNPNKRKVEMWTMNGLHLKTFKTITEAAKSIGGNISPIYSSCLRNNSICYGYQWKFFNDSKIIRPYNAQNINQKKCYQYNLDGIFIKQYDSIKKASLKTKIDISDISKCCKKKNKSAGGFIWRFNNEEPEKYQIKSIKKVAKLDSKNNVIKKYNSIKEAAKAHNISANSISYVCKGKQKTSAGYKWKYV